MTQQQGETDRESSSSKVLDDRTTLSLPLEGAPTETIKPDALRLASLYDSPTSLHFPTSDELAHTLQNLRVLAKEGDEHNDDIPDIRITDFIGAGGMGQVHGAVQTSLQREIAIKRLNPDRKGDHAEKGMLREAFLLGRLEHPAIPPVHLIGRDQEGRSVIVMKKIGGRPWSEHLTDVNGDSSRRQLISQLHIFITVGNAAAFAHSRGIIHRDIKPANVMVDDFGEVYLIDWGLAMELEKDGTCDPLGYAGTPAYSAPEMITPNASLSARTDIYLLGAMLHEVLTGQPRHLGDTVPDVLERAMVSEPCEYDPEVPPTLASICNRATAADPEERFSDAQGLIDEVEQYITFMDAIDEAEEGRLMLDQLRIMTSDPTADAGVIEELGIRCRYALSRAMSSWPDNAEARTDYLDCLLLLTRHALIQQNISATRVLLEELEQNPENEEAITDIRNQLNELIRQYDTKPGELSTQIQYTLMEKIAEAHAKQTRTDDKL